MFTDIDSELYPDDCEVAVMSPHQSIYLINKNGSSTLRRHCELEHLPMLKNKDIGNLRQIDILIRDPFERWCSGVNTFATWLVRDNPGLDLDTCIWMACKYRFLNKHYLPQFLWLVNLARFLDPQCRLTLKDFSELGEITRYHNRPGPVLDERTKAKIKMHGYNEQWLFIDKILQDNIGRSLTWQEILDLYDQHPARPLKDIQTKSRELIDVLR